MPASAGEAAAYGQPEVRGHFGQRIQHRRRDGEVPEAVAGDIDEEMQVTLCSGTIDWVVAAEVRFSAAYIVPVQCLLSFLRHATIYGNAYLFVTLAKAGVQAVHFSGFRPSPEWQFSNKSVSPYQPRITHEPK